MWTSVIGMYLLTALAITHLRRSWVRVVSSCQKRLSQPIASSRTILLCPPPYSLMAPLQAASSVHAQWASISPSRVFEVRAVRATFGLPKLVTAASSAAAQIRSLELQLSTLRLESTPQSDAYLKMSDAERSSLEQQARRAPTRAALL